MKKIFLFLTLSYSILFSQNCLFSADNYKYELVCVSMFKNEAPYLKEWIEFHKLVGVQHFILYNNVSDDNYLEVLEYYINTSEVELIDWPYTTDGNWNHIQCNAFRDGVKRTEGVAKWVAFLDLDEFLFAAHDDNLVEFLRAYEDFGGLCVNWVCYGTSFVPKKPDNKLAIETFTLRGKDNCGCNRCVKSIVRPERVREPFQSAHYFNYKDGYYQITPERVQFSGAITSKSTIDDIRINHYWTRDEDYFWNVKVKKRLQWGDKIEFLQQMYNEFNQKYDDAIFKFIPALKNKMNN